MSSESTSDSLNFLIIEMARLVRARFEERVAQAGLGVTPAEARMLAHLNRWGPQRQNALAERLGVAQMSVCGFVDRLETAGLVRRVPDPDDRRAKQVHLTAEAAPVIQSIAAIGAEVRRLARGDMPDETWEAFNAVAQQVRDNLATAAPKVPSEAAR